jgi:hypothetical protein
MEVATYATSGSGVRYVTFTLGLGIDFRQNIPYRFVVRLKSVSGATGLKLWVGSEGSNTNSASTTPTITTAWADYAVDWTPSLDATDVVLVIMVNSAATATFRVDSVHFGPGSTTLNFEPTFAVLDTEDLRAPDYAGSGAASSLLSALNAVAGTRHWVETIMVAPWWAYHTETLATATAQTSAETITEEIESMAGLERDAAAVVNVQAVAPGTKYLDADGDTVANTADGTAYASDRNSVANGGRTGAAISSDLLENKVSDRTIQQAIADAIVARRADSLLRPTIVRRNNWPSQLARQLGDVITLTFARQRIYSQRYSVLSLETRVSQSAQEWTTTYVLEEVP